jgi:hypothetical protein
LTDRLASLCDFYNAALQQRVERIIARELAPESNANSKLASTTLGVDSCPATNR